MPERDSNQTSDLESRLTGATGPLLVGAYLIQPSLLRASCGDVTHRLEPRTLSVLMRLAQTPGETVTREELVASVWNGQYVTEDVLNRAVYKLRKLFDDDPKEPTYIETIPTVGYRLLATVEPATAKGDRGSDERPRDPSPRRRIRRPAVIGIAALGLTIAILGAVFLSRNPETAWIEPRSVVVPSFQSLSSSGENDWLARGLAEMIGRELAQSSALHVVPKAVVDRSTNLRPSSPNEERTLSELRSLGADLVLLGSYEVVASPPESPAVLRLDLLVLESEADREILARSYYGSIASVSQLTHTAGGELRRELAGHPSSLFTRKTTSALPQDAESIRLYTDGLILLGRHQPSAARAKLEQSLEAEPSQAFAQLALGETWAMQGQTGKAAEASRAALESSGQLPPHQRLWIEARALGLGQKWQDSATVYRQLWDAFPENLEYGVDLAAAFVEARDPRAALETVAELRGRAGTDHGVPTIDLLESKAAILLGEFDRAATAAVAAAGLGRESGRSRAVAEAVAIQAEAAWNLGQARRARALVEEAQILYEAIGDHTAMEWLRLTVAQWDAVEVGNEELLEDGLADVRRAFRELGNPIGEAAALRSLGAFQAKRRDLQGGEANLEEALEIQKAHRDPLEQAETRKALGVAFAINGRYGRATEEFQEALSLYRQIGNRDQEQRTLNNLARTALLEGRVGHAKSRWDEVYRLAKDLQNERSVARVQFNRAHTSALAGDLPTAISAFEESITIYRRLEAHRMLGSALEGLAQVQISALDLSAARRSIGESLTIRRGLGDQARLADSYHTLCLLEFESGRLAEAEAAIRQAITLLEDPAADRSDDLSLLARVLAVTDDLPSARSTLRQAQGDSGLPIDINGIYSQLNAARVLVALQQFEEAEAILDQVKDLSQQGGAWQAWAESELIRGELAVARGTATDFEDRLQQLEEQASQRGYERLAQRARQLSTDSSETD